MDDRICGTCRHFERAPGAGQGWCRNPRLYTAGQSQPVSEFELACANPQGDYWEAGDEYFDAAQQAGMEPDSNDKRSDEYDEDAIQSGGNQMRSSGSDRPRSSDDPVYGSDDPVYGSGEPTAPRGRSGGERVPPPPGSSGFGGGSGDRDRAPGYQAEERYWTDYLRIALPIAGLLLLLSVFWFWASSFIGGNDKATETPVVAIVTPQTDVLATPALEEAVVLPTPTQLPVIQPTTAPVEQPTQAPVEEPTQEPVQPETPVGEFAEGDLVIINDNNVNMRSEPSTDGSIVDTLSQGTELQILDGVPVESGGYTWWNVSDNITGVEGWVAGIFLEK